MLHTLTRPGSTITAFTALLASIVFIGVNAPNASAEEIYKWVDENGVVTFGDKSQRPTTAPVERVDIKAHAPSPNATSKTGKESKAADGNNPDDVEAGKKQDETKDGKQEQAKPPAADEKPKMPVAEKRKRCKQARADLAVIQSRGQVRESDAKGNTVYLSEQQKQNRIKALNKNIREYCR